MPNAVITGATQGIGKAIAEQFLTNGFSVAVCARTEEDLSKLQKEWTERFPASQIQTYIADLSVKEQVIQFAKNVTAHFEVIDVLINNAGVFIPGKLTEEDDGHLEKMIKVNLYSAYYLTRALLPNIKQQAEGHIFNICSVASLRAYPNGGSYSISKYALLGFSENLREELKDKSIMVTAVCPGATLSRSWENADIDKKRLMEANDVAQMVWTAYNLSDKANVETIVMRPTKGDL